MKHQDILQAAPQVAVEQETFPPPAFMQEQIDHITGQLGENDREAFLDAVSRYGLARVRVGEKAIGEMGNQIRESEENTAERFDTAHDAVEAWTRRKTNALWRARDEAVNELLYEYVPEDDPKHAVISPAYEIQQSADKFLDNRVAGLKEKAAASLDAKVDAAMPDKPSAADEEGVAIIGMFNFDESAQEKLDILEGLLDNVKPKNLGRKVLHMVSGQPAPEKWTTDEEISAAIRDFTATIDQVSQHGVNDTVREAIAEHVSRYGLLYPSAEDYVNLAERSIKEVAHLFDPGTTKKAVIEHLETTTISMLRDMGYVTVEKEETPTEEPQSAEESGPKRIELDVAVMQEINNRIKELRDKGFPDKRIFKKLSPYYHPDTTQLPREYFQYFESRFRDSDE